MPRSLNSSLMKPLVVLALPGMYLAYKIGEYKRHQQEQHRRKVTERELTHLNHKIDKLLNKLEEHEPEMASSQDEECVICINAKATMQTFPCGHRVVCRKCFVKTIQMAVSQRLLPLRCVVCRTKILRLKQSGSPNCPAPTPIPPGALPLRSSPTLQRLKRMENSQHLCVLHNHDRYTHTRVSAEEATTVLSEPIAAPAPPPKSTRYRSGGRYKSNHLFTILEKEEAEQADAAIRSRMPGPRSWAPVPCTPPAGAPPPPPSWRTAPSSAKRNPNGFKSYPRSMNSEHRSKSSSAARARLQQQKAIRVAEDEADDDGYFWKDEDKPDPWRLASAALQEEPKAESEDDRSMTLTLAEIHAIPEEAPAKARSAKLANKVSPMTSELETITTLEKTVEVVPRPSKDIAKPAALLPPPPPPPGASKTKKKSEVRRPAEVTKSSEKKNRRRGSNLEFWKKSPSKVQPVSSEQASPPPLEDSWGVSPRRFAGLLSPGGGSGAGYEKLDSSPSRKSPSRSFLARNYEKLEAWTRGGKAPGPTTPSSEACWGVSPFAHAGYEKLDSWSPSSQPKNLTRAKISPLVTFQHFRHRSSVKAFRFK